MEPIMSSKTGMINNHIMSFSFFLLFCSYYTAQNFATTLDPVLGPISLGILYFVWILSLLTISTPGITYFTPKYGMFIGSLTYSFYVLSGSGIIQSHVLYMVASVLIGIGAGLLWVGSSIFVVDCCNMYENVNKLPSNSRLGLFNGIFNTYLNSSRFIGNLTAALIFQFNGSIQTMFIVIIIICLCGSFMFLFIKQTHAPDVNKHKDKPIQVAQTVEIGNTPTKPDNSDVITKDKSTEPSPNNIDTKMNNSDAIIKDKSLNISSFKQEMKEIILLWKNRTFLYILPLTFASGLYQSFIASDISTLIIDDSFKFYILSIEGFISGISSFIIGKLSDKFGSLYLILISCSCFNIVFIFFYFWDQHIKWIWIACAIILGIGDGGLFTLVPQIYPILLGNDNKAIFANLRIFQAIAMCIGFAYYPITTFSVRLTFNLIMMILAVIFIYASIPIRTALLVFTTKEVQITNKHISNNIENSKENIGR